MPVRYVITALLSFVLASCMHPIMEDHHDMKEATPEPILQKEVANGKMNAVATFPSMEYGKDAFFSLKLSDRKTSQSISGARIFAQVEYLHQPDRQNRMADSNDLHRVETEHGINWSGEMIETNEQGVYVFSYKCFQPGEHTVVYRIAAIGDEALDPPVIITAKRFVAAQTNHQNGRMTGMGGTPIVLVMSAAVMGVLMFAVLVANGRIF